MTVASEIVYPDSDDEPMAENTRQYRWIEMVKGNLEALFNDQDDVFVAGDLFWYPVEGRPDIVTAPDSLVAFGRPKGERSSYMQWREGNIAPQVVFEILSPSNTPGEMETKRLFYQRYGVQEYYEYDPERITLKGWQRQDQLLMPIFRINGWISPRLNIRFMLPGEGQELRIYRPDGRLFVTLAEIDALFQQAQQQARLEHQRAEQEYQQRMYAETARQEADTARQEADTARREAEQALAAEKQRVAELLARLGEGGQGQAQ